VENTELKLRLYLAPILLLGLIASLPFMVPEVSAYTGSHDETFIDDAFIDELATNVTGLESGAISLPKRGLELQARLEYPSIWSGNELKIVGDIAYIVTHFNQLYIYNISDTTNPTYISNLEINGTSSTTCMDIVDDLLYLPTHSGLDIINISNPLNPEYLACYSWLTAIGQVIVQDNVAYVSNGLDGMMILNVSDPKAATSISNYTEMVGTARCVAIKGDRAYIGDNGAIHVVNLTDIYNPTQILKIPAFVGGHAILVEGNLLVYQAMVGPMFFDISTPDNPLSIHNMTIGVMHFTIDSNRFYCSYGALKVFDITNPANPIEIWWQPGLNSSHNIRDIVVSGDYIYFAGNYPEFGIYRYKDTTGYYWDQYALSAVIQTDPLFTSNDLDSIVDVTLQVDDLTPSNTAIDYYVSASNGSWWTEAVPGIKQSVGAYRGQQMKWRVELSTSDRSVTPTIESVNATCTALLDKIHSTAPELGATLDDNTPLFSWESVEGAESYLLQIDTTQDFDSSNLISVTIPGTWSDSYQLVEPLSDGDWVWQVAGIDGEGQIGEFSPAIPFTIDTGAGGTSTGTVTNPLPIPEDLMLYIIIGVAGIAIIAFVIVLRRR